MQNGTMCFGDNRWTPHRQAVDRRRSNAVEIPSSHLSIDGYDGMNTGDLGIVVVVLHRRVSLNI